MIPLSEQIGFACHEETNWVWSVRKSKKGRFLPPICQISFYHDWDALQEYAVEKYSRLRRDNNVQFRSKWQTLGAYAKKMGVEPKRMSSLALANNNVSNNRTIVPVCYGGNFLVRNEQLLSQPPEFWKRMEEIEASLTRANNIAEGHYVERLWGTILASPLHPDLINRVLKQEHQRGECQVDSNHLGALCK